MHYKLVYIVIILAQLFDLIVSVKSFFALLTLFILMDFTKKHGIFHFVFKGVAYLNFKIMFLCT